MARYEMLPSFVGSKKKWVSSLQEFGGMPFIEPFCGSAALSFNLASRCLLNDTDSAICKIASRFDELIVPEVFTPKDYAAVRGRDDWWKYAYCLQAMSFSGVFRHSKNGYNVPIKPNAKPASLRPRYKKSLARWAYLRPIVTNTPYWLVPTKAFAGSIAVMDPPYSGSKASYNVSGFDYQIYWDWLHHVKHIAEAVIVFDRVSNLKAKNIPSISSRAMRVNGARAGDVEGMAIYSSGNWRRESQMSLNI